MEIYTNSELTEVKSCRNSFVTGFYRNYAIYRQLFAAKLQNTKKTAKITKNNIQKDVYNSKFLRPAAILALSFLFGFTVGRTFLPVNRAKATQITDVSGALNATKVSAKTEKNPISRANSTTITNSHHTVATNSAPVVSSGLSIPSVGISTPVVASAKAGNTLSVPSNTASIYGSLIMGHVFGIFGSLSNTAQGQEIYLNGQKYIITSVARNLAVSSNLKTVGGYNMNQLVNYNGLVLMTCAGSYSNALGTYTHRTLVFATKAA